MPAHGPFLPWSAVLPHTSCSVKPFLRPSLCLCPFLCTEDTVRDEMVRRKSLSPLLPTQVLPCNIFVTVHLALIPSFFSLRGLQAPCTPEHVMGLCGDWRVRGSVLGTGRCCTEGKRCLQCGLLTWFTRPVYSASESVSSSAWDDAGHQLLDKEWPPGEGRGLRGNNRLSRPLWVCCGFPKLLAFSAQTVGKMMVGLLKLLNLSCHRSLSKY